VIEVERLVEQNFIQFPRRQERQQVNDPVIIPMLRSEPLGSLVEENLCLRAQLERLEVKFGSNPSLPLLLAG
jgi:hypothetical protein